MVRMENEVEVILCLAVKFNFHITFIRIFKYRRIGMMCSGILRPLMFQLYLF